MLPPVPAATTVDPLGSLVPIWVARGWGPARSSQPKLVLGDPHPDPIKQPIPSTPLDSGDFTDPPRAGGRGA